jgi:hypothetical protein
MWREQRSEMEGCWWWCFGGGLEEGFFLIWAFCEIEREEEVWSVAIGMK